MLRKLLQRLFRVKRVHAYDIIGCTIAGKVAHFTVLYGVEGNLYLAPCTPNFVPSQEAYWSAIGKEIIAPYYYFITIPEQDVYWIKGLSDFYLYKREGHYA